MFHVENKLIKSKLFLGNFGLEKENLRITPDGHMAHTTHPFGGHKHIVRDFCENQTEINTSVLHTSEEAIESLYAYTREIQRELAQLPEPELLWPFSNPPYIINESDIPIAKFTGEQAVKTAYREYLSDRYGRYKMTFCGIHVNFSFADELLKEDFLLSDTKDYNEYKDRVYLDLAERASAYGWILTAITAASPLLDSSFIEKKTFDGNAFNGMASTRCSELGYWNYFTPIFDYTDIRAYADSIQEYVDTGLISAPSELYYPIRLKPSGDNDLLRLRNEGADHIELRMFDLNPLCPEGLDIRDLKFAHLLLVFLASTTMPSFSAKHQVQAAQNFKNAAHYDLKTVKIVMPDDEVLSVVEAGQKVISSMRNFFKDTTEEITAILDFEEQKFIEPETRYAWKLRRLFADGFVKGGLELAKKYQEEAIHV